MFIELNASLLHRATEGKNSWQIEAKFATDFFSVLQVVANQGKQFRVQ